MQSPRVSILMATWNRAHLIGRTIESVRAQTFGDWELVITDDGSIDETPKVVAEWKQKEPRIVYVRSEANEGPSKNYNRGLKATRGEYVAMIDDDDLWADQNKLKEQVEFLDTHRDYVACGGGMIVIDPTGEELYRYLKPETDVKIRDRMLFANPMANSTTCFRRATAEAVGWYDAAIPYHGDRDFWCKMGLTGKMYNFQKYFSYYTMSGTNITILKLREHLKASLLVMKRYKNSYPHYAPALFVNELEYVYSFLPACIRVPIHATMAQLKRRVLG